MMFIIYYFLSARQTYIILVFIQVSVKLLIAVYGSNGVLIDNGRQTHSNCALCVYFGVYISLKNIIKGTSVCFTA